MKGKRNFVLVIDETGDLTEGELVRALQRTAGNINSGRGSIESGSVINSTGKRIGRYSWQTPPPVPETS